MGIEAVGGRFATSSPANAHNLDAIASVPLDRWDADLIPEATLGGRFGGFVHEWAGFDAGAFGISPSEAAFMDPQQRILLEVMSKDSR